MKYPASIYSDFEIVEKEIYGEKHYGLIRKVKVLGITFRRHQKITDVWGVGKISTYGDKWVNKEFLIHDAISLDNRRREGLFKKKVTN